MKHERLVTLGLDQRGQLVLLQRRVDVGVAGVDEDSEKAVQSHVDAGGLEQLVVERVDGQASSVELGPQVTVGQQHGVTLASRTRLTVRVPWQSRHPC